MWAVTICNNIKKGTGERMEERKDEICEGCEVHEDLLKIVNETLPEETELYDLAELFKVFGDSTRIRILFVLFEAEVCVCDLAKVLNMTQSAISHQLRILKQISQVQKHHKKACPDLPLRSLFEAEHIYYR